MTSFDLSNIHTFNVKESACICMRKYLISRKLILHLLHLVSECRVSLWDRDLRRRLRAGEELLTLLAAGFFPQSIFLRDVRDRV